MIFPNPWFCHLSYGAVSNTPFAKLIENPLIWGNNCDDLHGVSLSNEFPVCPKPENLKLVVFFATNFNPAKISMK